MLGKIILVILIILLFFIIILPVILQLAGVNVFGPGFLGGGGGGREAALFRSSDGGQSFKQAEFRREGGADAPSEISDIAFHPSSPEILFAGARASGLWISRDGGATWTPLPGVSRGFSGRTEVFAVSVPRADPKVIYAAVFAERRGRILKSKDGGENFSEIYRVTGEGFGVFDVYAAPQDAERVIIATGEGGAFESRDGGKTWRPLRWFGEVLSRIFVNPFSLEDIYVLTSRGKVFKTSDGGSNWKDITKNIERLRGSGVPLPLPREREREGFSIFGAGSRGGVAAFAPDPSFFNIVHAGTGSGLLRSVNGGAAWDRVELPTPPSAGEVSAIAAHPRDPHALYVGLGRDIYHSADGGVRWSRTTLPGSGRIAEIFIHPQNPEIVFVSTNR